VDQRYIISTLIILIFSLNISSLFSSDNGPLNFESNDKNYCLTAEMRINVDGAYFFDNLNPLSSGTKIRRFRIAFKTLLWSRWGAVLDIGFKDLEADIKDAFINYLFDGGMLKIGHYRMPFGLELNTNANDIKFLERPYVTEMHTSRQIGLGMDLFGERWYFGGAVFTQGLGNPAVNRQYLEKGNDQPLNFAGGFVYRPVHAGSSIFHIGFSAALQKPEVPKAGSPQNSFRFCSMSETDISRKMFMDTGDILNSKNMKMLNLETAVSHGPFLVQSEYTIADISRRSGYRVVNLSGWYVSGAWLITGENQSYDIQQAEYTHINPGSGGAFELAARYSYADWNDKKAGIFGGQAENYTLGLNYYVNPNVRIMFNYNYVNQDCYANGDGSLYVYKDAGGTLYKEAPDIAAARKSGDSFHFLAVRFQLIF